MTQPIKNTSDLRVMLLDAIEGVRKGKVDHRQAQAISALSSRVLQSARLDLDVMKMNSTEQSLRRPAAVSLLPTAKEPVQKRVAAKK